MSTSGRRGVENVEPRFVRTVNLAQRARPKETQEQSRYSQAGCDQKPCISNSASTVPRDNKPKATELDLQAGQSGRPLTREDVYNLLIIHIVTA
jgi:hypothetical protein